MDPEFNLTVNKSTDETANQFYIERTDDNKQFFNLQFNRNMSFLSLSDIQLFMREQNPQYEEPDTPTLNSSEAF